MKGVVDPLPSFPNQGRVRHSDINIDGYGDLFLTLEFTDKTKKSVVLMSHACTVETCPEAAAVREVPRRYFNASDKVVNINRISDLAGDSSVMLVPIDIDEDGRMDIIVQKTINGVQSLGIIYNNFQFDSFFIKAMMLSQTSGDPEEMLSGAVTSGATFRFAVTTLDDKKQIRVGTQLAQTSYNSLSLPYVYLGLGRSNNFIESFNVAYSINNKLDQVKVFTPIIPNSQLFILANNKYAKDWSLELFINPDKKIYMIVFACCGILFVTGIAIIILHIQEKKEDSKNRP